MFYIYQAEVSSKSEMINATIEQVADILDQDIVQSEPKPFKLAKKFFKLCLDTGNSVKHYIEKVG